MDLELQSGEIRSRLLALPDVTSKRQFGNETFYVNGSRFAAITTRSLVMHLPPRDLIAVLKAGIARPFVSMGAMGRHGWVEVNLGRISPEILDGLLACAHDAGTRLSKGPAAKPRKASRVRRPTASRRSNSPA